MFSHSKTWCLPESCVSLVFKGNEFIVFRLLTLAPLGFTTVDCFRYGQQSVSFFIHIYLTAPDNFVICMFSYFVVLIQPGKH
jgi:hypothetical protein